LIGGLFEEKEEGKRKRYFRLSSRKKDNRKKRGKRTVGTTAAFPLPFVLVAALAVLPLPAFAASLLLSLLFAALEPRTPPRTAPRMMITPTMAPTTQGHLRPRRLGCFEGGREGKGQFREGGKG
jgi:hypothetical protein